jgi:hypothetical protein
MKILSRSATYWMMLALVLTMLALPVTTPAQWYTTVYEGQGNMDYLYYFCWERGGWRLIHSECVPALP